MKFFTRRRAAVLATAVALAAGSLATAPAASADAGPWPGTEGKILFDGPQLYDPATGAVTQVSNTYDGDWSAWAPDGSRLVSAWQDVQSIRPSGASKVTLPDGEGFHASYIPRPGSYGSGAIVNPSGEGSDMRAGLLLGRSIDQHFLVRREPRCPFSLPFHRPRWLWLR
ncbi:hypothetical protein ABZT51_07760, partial [Streptomyces sp. NPDC005373]